MTMHRKTIRRAATAASSIASGSVNCRPSSPGQCWRSRDLLGARYAALGVLGPDGGLEQFVHDGMDEELVARIGDLHTGRGILVC